MSGDPPRWSSTQVLRYPSTALLPEVIGGCGDGGQTLSWGSPQSPRPCGDVIGPPHRRLRPEARGRDSIRGLRTSITGSPHVHDDSQPVSTPLQLCEGQGSLRAPVPVPAVWSELSALHESPPTRETCDVSIKKRYPGGVFYNTPTIFDDLREEGIALPNDALYFPYRACFYFEAFLQPLETDDSTTSKTVWIDRHIPMSVSVNANVPGYQHPRCFVSDGDPYALMATSIEYLNEISAASYQRMLLKFESVLAVLDAGIPAQTPGQPKLKPPPYAAVLKTKLLKYLAQLPVLGLNTGWYDFNMVKRYMYPYLAHRQTLKYVIKNNRVTWRSPQRPFCF